MLRVLLDADEEEGADNEPDVCHADQFLPLEPLLRRFEVRDCLPADLAVDICREIGYSSTRSIGLTLGEVIVKAAL